MKIIGRQQFSVDGEPVPKGRPRFTRWGKPYTPEKTRTAEQAFYWAAYPYKPAQPWEGAVAIEIHFYRSIPRGTSKANFEAAEKGHIRPTTKPDVDNCVKLVMDTLNKLFYKDDNQVISLNASKYYGLKPHTQVFITYMQNETATVTRPQKGGITWQAEK